MTLYSDVEKDWWALVNEKTPEKTALDIATLFLCNETVRHTFPRAHLCFFEHAPQLDASCVALRIDQMPREAIAKYLKNTKAFCGSVDATVCSPNFYGVGIFLNRVKADPQFFIAKKVTRHIIAECRRAAAGYNQTITQTPSLYDTVSRERTRRAIIASMRLADFMRCTVLSRGQTIHKNLEKQHPDGLWRMHIRTVFDICVGLHAMNFPNLVLCIIAQFAIPNFYQPTMYEIWTAIDVCKRRDADKRNKTKKTQSH